MVLSIQYLRGIAAITVFFSHCVWFINGQYVEQNLGTMLFSQLAFGVDLFFVISGFVICLASEKETSALHFIIKRFFRIYPVMILMIISLAIYNGLEFNYENLKTVLRSMIPLHKDYGSNPPFFGYNFYAPAWTLTYELFFYSIFALTFLVRKSTSRWLYCSLLCLLSVFTIQLTFNGHVTLVNYKSLIPLVPHFTWLLSIASSPMLVDFVFGMIAYAIYKHFPRRFSSESFRYSLIFILLLSCLVIQSGVMMPNHNPMDFGFQFLHGPRKWGLVAFVIVLCAVLYEKNYGLKIYEPLKKLGDISYSFYLFQLLAFSFITDIGNRYGITGFSQVFFALFINLGVSFMLYTYVEKPSIRLARIFINKI